MFQFARTSAKAVLVAAGTAGFVALGAGAASAGSFGATDAALQPSLTPSAAGVPAALKAQAEQVQRDAEVPHVAHTLPAPSAGTGEVSGLAHKGANALPGAGLPGGGLPEAPEAELPGGGLPNPEDVSASETGGLLLMQVCGTAGDLGGKIAVVEERLDGADDANPADAVKGEAPEVEADAVKGKADTDAVKNSVPAEATEVPEAELPEADAGALEAPEAAEATDAVEDATETVEDAGVKDTAGEVADVDAPASVL